MFNAKFKQIGNPLTSGLNVTTQLKIFRPIVIAYAIFMVHDFKRFQFSSEDIFHYAAMLFVKFTFKGHNSIPIADRTALPIGMVFARMIYAKAFVRTGIYSSRRASQMRHRPINFLFASSALNNLSSLIKCANTLVRTIFLPCKNGPKNSITLEAQSTIYRPAIEWKKFIAVSYNLSYI